MVERYSDLYLRGRKLLLKTEGEQAGLIARELLSKASGYTTEEILARRELYAAEPVIQAYDRLLERKCKDEPLPYILGQWDFYGMTLALTPDVLIPRDDTMAVTELAIEAVRRWSEPVRVLDLCTGSGCIGLAVAKMAPQARVVLGDVSHQALRVARKNIVLQKLGGRVTCLPLDVTKPAAPFLGKFEVLVSNPPYVTNAEMEQLPPSVKDYEPHLALCGGEDGLDFYRHILQNFRSCIKPGGFLCFEFGMGQAPAVQSLLEANGCRIVQIKEDTRGIVRAVLARTESEDA